MRKSTSAAALLTAGLVFGACSSGFAQTGGNAQAGQGQPPEATAATDERPELRAPVLKVISVEVLRSTHGGVLDIIRVRGLTSSSGWEEAELVPLTRGIPADGMLDLVLVARAPAEAMEAKGFEPIEAILPIESSHPYKGINVHSASESVTLTQLPGYVEGKVAAEDCSKCVGKMFVAKGAALPAGRSTADVVKEEQLPPVTRVIKHSDGIPSAESNPNRLTIVLSKDGTIATAIWD